MRDDVTLVEMLERDLREVRWPEPAEIRAIARSRSRRTAVVAAVAVLAVASVSAVAVSRTGATSQHPDVAAGGRLEIPVEALLAPTDVPVGSDERLGGTGVGERVRTDDILRACAQDQGLPTDQPASRHSRSQTLIGTAEVAGFAPYRRPVISQHVYRLDPGAAKRLFVDLDRSVAACQAWNQVSPVQTDQGMIIATVVHSWTVSASDFAGDQAILLRHTISPEVDPATGEPVGITPAPEYRLVVRVGDLVTVLVPEAPLQPDTPVSGVTQAHLLDLARAAVDRMCPVADPGC